MKMKPALSAALFAAALASVLMQAPAVDTDPPPPVSGEFTGGRKAIEAKDWIRAIKSLHAAAQRDSRNAGNQNLLGCAYHNASQLDPAFKH